MELTPVEEFNGILLKRDDKFILGEVNGGKLRQAIYLIEKNLKTIKTKHNNEVICSCSIKSPQSSIISEVCKIYGLKCKIVSYKTKQPNINLTIAQKNKAVLIQSPSGYTSVIESIARKQSGFWINMGFESEEVIEANINQVMNLPNNLDYLVVPVGSAMNFISILKGIENYGIRIKNIVGVYVGKDPRPTLKKYFSNPTYELIKSPYNYGQELNYFNYFFDPIYEAKAYDWIIKNLDIKNNKILLWVVGKRNLNHPTEEIKWQ